MKRSNLVWVVIAVLVVALLGTGIFIYMQHKEMSDFKEQVEIDKQRSELEKEYSDLAAQYDQFEGQKMMFNNDSLIEKLDAEKVKVQRLLEELRTVKNTSSARIEELKRELTTLRGIMRHYVMQIDSLNVANKQLREENAIDSRGKTAKKIKKTDKIKITFSIAKNVTAEVGEKYIYARIVKPDGDVLVKDRADVFPFEDREINYSCRKLIEYTGEELNDVTMYWAVEEFLYPGEYRVDIFADNYMIGTRSFTLKQ